MESIGVNGVECPILKRVDGLPVITFRGHNGVVASSEEDAANLMFDGTSFWCPVNLIRPSVGDENIRKDAPSETEISKTRNLLRIRKDIGTIKIVVDATGLKPFRILDGNTRYPLFLEECSPSHVFSEYCEVQEDELAIINEQIIANTHNPTSEKAQAFYSLRGKLLAKDLPDLEEREKQLAILYADAGGKAMFAKRCARAQNAIAPLWESLANKEITISNLDAIATLVNPHNGKILAELQQEVLTSAIAHKLNASQIQAKVAAALINWEAQWEESQKPVVAKPDPKPVLDVKPDEDGTFAMAKPKGITRPQGVAVSPVPSTPNPLPVKEPKAVVTSAQVKQQQQQVKATKGTGGTKKAPAASAAKVITNAPPPIVTTRSTAPPKFVPPIVAPVETATPVDVYQILLDVEELWVAKKLVNGNGSGVPTGTFKHMETMSLRDVDNILSQVSVLKALLGQIESISSAIQMDLKDSLNK
ncbi:hypothetical protein [Pseudanabaena sp. 'Roaring Creek']|uniref:hypothetical protein n=1 Tax=Pseudanabaena sp. 'Roaring Creek' TaxID=1681830 RepID=UPI0006D787E9|nr:hypothetical protein [Pseudanabaena sp. 'Roaring Creek']